MVKWPLSAEEGGDLYVDPFHGGARLDEDACRRFILGLLARNTEAPLTWSPASAPNESADAERQIEMRAAHLRFNAQWSAAVGVRDILTRMLNNLKIVYLHRGDLPLALAVVERLVALRPNQPVELRDRGLLRLAMNEPLLADADL